MLDVPDAFYISALTLPYIVLLCERPGGKLFLPTKASRHHPIFSLGNPDAWAMGGLCVHILPAVSFQGLISVVGQEEERVGPYIYKLQNERLWKIQMFLYLIWLRTLFATPVRDLGRQACWEHPWVGPGQREWPLQNLLRSNLMPVPLDSKLPLQSRYPFGEYLQDRKNSRFLLLLWGIFFPLHIWRLD